MKKVLPNLITSQKTAYTAQRCLNESAILISDFLSVTKKMKVKGYLVAIDIGKTFDSFDHTFVISTLDKFGFGKTFIDWIKIFLNEQESCVINGGITTKYFKATSNPMSAFIFILCLEILFMLIKTTKILKLLKCLRTLFFILLMQMMVLSFFLKDKNSNNYFSSFTGLKPNLSKCEVTGIGALKRVKVAICGIKCIYLTKQAIKIFGVFFSYDKNLHLENNCRKTVLNIERILKIWRPRNLTLESKIIISFMKYYFLGSSFSNSESDYRRITTNTKIFFMEFIFPESET